MVSSKVTQLVWFSSFPLLLRYSSLSYSDLLLWKVSCSRFFVLCLVFHSLLLVFTGLIVIINIASVNFSITVLKYRECFLFVFCGYELCSFTLSLLRGWRGLEAFMAFILCTRVPSMKLCRGIDGKPV